MLPSNNSMANVQDLVKLNEVLRKSSVGYQNPAVPSAGDALSPLVPQSIEGMLSVATHTMSEIVTWQMIPKIQVSNTVHEYVVVQEHGLDLDPFIAEGGGGSDDFGLSQSRYERKAVKIKYMAERRQITDVSSLVGLIGDNRDAMAEETMRGTLALMRKIETQILHGDESLNPEGFDGICKQLKDAGSSHDMKGSVPTPLLLQEVLGEVYSSPNFGRPDTILVEPRIHAELIRQSVENGRHDQLSIRSDSQLTFGSRNLAITAPYGEVQIKAAPFLHTASAAPAAAAGSAPFSAAPVVTFALNANADSELANGSYIYKVVAVGKKGYNAPVISAAQAVNGDEVVITLPAGSDCMYWRIYRSEKDGSADTCKLVARIPQGVAGATYTDAGQHKYNTSNILFLQNTPDALEFMRLLDLIRRPLAQTSTVMPFLLMCFGSVQVKLPKKSFMLEQAGFADTTGINPNYLNQNL